VHLPQLPIAISFGQPSRGEVIAAGACLSLLAAAVVGAPTTPIADALAQVWSTPARPTATLPAATVRVTTNVGDATVLVDSQPRANAATPQTSAGSLTIPLGRHSIAVEQRDAVSEERDIDLTADGADLDFPLWRRQPVVHTLKPSLPGAAIANASFLTDGRVALIVTLPGDEHQAWTLDPNNHFAIDRLGTVAPSGPVAIRPDGLGVAFLQRPADPAAENAIGSDRLSELWLAGLGDDDGHAAWAVDQPDEQLVDLTWDPDSRHLLVVGQQHPSLGMERTSLRWLDTATGTAQLLALLPSEVVPGSYVWRPDGHVLAFLVHTASLSAVCTLSDTGEFHYLGDLGHDGTAGPPVAPVAWGPDGQLVYAALKPSPPSASANSLGLGALTPVGLFLADPSGGPGRSFGSVDGLSPTWWPDGRFLLAGLPADRDTGLRLRELDAQGEAQELVSIDVATPSATGYGLRWDLARQRALLVTNHSGFDGGHDYALLDFDWSGDD
jgi:hypothetical protein